MIPLSIDLLFKFSLDITGFQNLYLVGVFLVERIQKQ